MTTSTLAEDILTPLGITLPYKDDGGNLTLELTIGAANVRGVAQVFSSSFAFGTYLLQEIQSTGITASMTSDRTFGTLVDGSDIEDVVIGAKGPNGMALGDK